MMGVAFVVHVCMHVSSTTDVLIKEVANHQSNFDSQALICNDIFSNLHENVKQSLRLFIT